ncbi:hypothetical protein PV328_012088 [Microctonus aethiopoides]|uniref:DUF4817 domain-containing protein n=1 Tax=Microctonus aethiopoides TaxID=144406 RepID=A0AA39C3W9_9HYME|nr:hypothetical protein PV328_012088 [Microctonus aethiopoides]
MAHVKLSEKERINILMIRGWGDRERSYDQVCTIFNEVYRTREGLPRISKSAVEKTIRRFRDHGTVANLPKSGRPRTVTTEEKRLAVNNSSITLRNGASVPDGCCMNVAIVNGLKYAELENLIFLVTRVVSNCQVFYTSTIYVL